MGMVHYDSVLQNTVMVVAGEISKTQRDEAYIIQNVYGKILIYVKTENDKVIKQLEDLLTAKIGKWLSGCEKYGENFFVISEIDTWKRSVEPVQERVWVLEKYLTNLYWDGKSRRTSSKERKSRRVCFYSFKGGVGRTTAVVLSAIELARQGKKIVIVDFDLEAPGIASLFPEESMSQYGLLDFLLESNVYDSEIKIDEYIYSVGEDCNVDKAGGEIYVMPAYGKVTKNNADLYRKGIMRFDLDTPAYEKEITPVDNLLAMLDGFLDPDYIFIDTRSGIHQIGGMTLTRYTDLALLFFYGSPQNTAGMKMTIPILKKGQIPFVMINSKVPVNEQLAEQEKRIYLEGAYDALKLCDNRYSNEEIAMEDDSADHYPIDVEYNVALEVINNIDQLLRVWEEQRRPYGAITNAILDTLSDEYVDLSNLSFDDPESQQQIIDVFSEIMGGLETAAAEDEFASIRDLTDNFYPLKAYIFIFDPRKFLVLGQKGVGKTALFNALKDNDYAKALAKYLDVSTSQYENTEWIVGTSQTTNYVDIFSCLKNEEQKIRAFLYYMAVSILVEKDGSLRELIEEKLSGLFEKAFEVSRCVMLTQETAYMLNRLLQKINDKYASQNKVVTIIYDSLDRTVAPKERPAFVSALIDMWYMNESTMQNIRSKIFLRKDIYDREVKVSDKVKLKNYSTTIGWEYDQLFAMIWKRAISKSQQMRILFEKITAKSFIEPEGLGVIPNVTEMENRKLLSALIGVKMGSGNKASTYNWFGNRLADTQGVIVPRSMIDIFAKAAAKETELRKGKTGGVSRSILRPRCFEEALPEVSEKRVTDMKEEFVEYASFLENLKDTLQRSPVDEKTFCDALMKAGFDNPREEIRNLVNIGIVRQYQRKLSDPIRYHFPDIYLRGLGLQRAGMK